ncbi:hypothetical protein [Halobacterium hubeiense]|uniref:hypothetical protein n=1 Tax=Halobacterium hubeiense TaxID=1407499 RepID=UPI003C75C476
MTQLDIEPLQRYVDADALVGEAAHGSVRVAFDYAAFGVVESTGTVEIYAD